MQETQVRSPGGEDPPEQEMATCSSPLAGKFHGQRSLADYTPWGHNESDMTEHTHTLRQEGEIGHLTEGSMEHHGHYTWCP